MWHVVTNAFWPYPAAKEQPWAHKRCPASPLHESPGKVYAAKITQTNLREMDSNQTKPKSWLKACNVQTLKSKGEKESSSEESIRNAVSKKAFLKIGSQFSRTAGRWACWKCFWTAGSETGCDIDSWIYQKGLRQLPVSQVEKIE